MRFFIIFFLFSYSFTLAQSLPKGFSQDERSPGFLNSMGITENPYENRSSSLNIYNVPPDENVRTMAEWEEIQALTITWSTSYNIEEEAILSQIVKHAVEQCQVIIICENQNVVIDYLEGENINTENVILLESNFNNIWIRDYGQNSVYKKDVEDLILVDWLYNRNRPYDDLVPDQIAEYLNLDLYTTSEAPWDLMSTGGNFMSDGMGLGFSSELIIDENSGGYAWEGPEGIVSFPDQSLMDINDIMFEFMGIEEYILMETLPFDGIHHIDMHMKLLNEETLLVAEYPEGIADGPQIEANLQYVLANYNSSFDTPFKVVRIPSPPSSSGNYPDNNGYYRTYTNSVFINNSVLVPFYRTEYDSIAQRIYEEALPGYNIIGIDVDNQGENLISYSGAIHCITHSVGVNDPLLIQHQSLENTYPQNEYVFNANIQHRSGIQSANLYWTTDLNLGYQQVSMTNTDGNNWQATITENIPSPNTVYYYIEATSNSGKSLNRPLPAPAGYFHFEILENQSVDISTFQDAIISLDVFPNPASAITCIPVHSSIEQIGKLSLIDIYGREISVIHDGNIPNGLKNYFFKANEFSSGVYFIVLKTDNQLIRQKLIIQ